MGKKILVFILIILTVALFFKLYGCAEVVKEEIPATTTTTTSTSSTTTSSTTTSSTTTTVPGDVNGDGFPEVVVGAFNADGGGLERGEAYLYFGGDPMNNSADLIFSGLDDGDYLGTSVSFAGDVNKDGYTDVIVGAPFAEGGGTQRGQAYIYFGGPSMDNNADLALYGENDNDIFGVSVSSAGDVNNDGYDDVIVGAPFAKDVTMEGKAYIYFGGPAMDNIADVTFSGTAYDDRFGFDVSAAGDVNNDGYDDVIVGAPNADSSGTDEGKAFIYFGGSAMDDNADIILVGLLNDDEFGFAVSSAGDVNKDGYTDVIIGARFSDAGGSKSGQAYIFFGGDPMNITADVTFTESASSNLGTSVASAGDVNNDGYPDVIVGAPNADGVATDEGKAYIYFGGASMDEIADSTFSGAEDDDHLGVSVSSAGDINRDGYNDVIVGAYHSDAGGLNSGQAYIFFGGAFADPLADVTFTGKSANDFLGVSVAGAE